MVGSLVPQGLGVRLWRLSLALNPHHRGAAAQRALALLDRDPETAWEAFTALLKQLRNPNNTSASDLYLTWVPGRLIRRWIARPLGLTSTHLEKAHHQALTSSYADLARMHFDRALSGQQFERAAEALDARRSLGEKSLDLRWATADLAWQRGDLDAALPHLQSLVPDGVFTSPLAPEQWAERLLAVGQQELAEVCLNSARDLIPDSAACWLLTADLERDLENLDSARDAGERAIALDPQNLTCFCVWQGLLKGRDIRLDDGPMDLNGFMDLNKSMDLTVPSVLQLGASATINCRIEDASSDWVLFALPPIARGIVPKELETPFDATGHATVQLVAHRPHRICGSAWTVLLVALGPTGYRCRSVEIEVPDTSPGQVWVSITEDHEIHEEREILSPAMLQTLLVDKSRFAADSGVPWTHFVETGSAVTMPALAAESGESAWTNLAQETRDHLVDELCLGNDLQPHLHAFNDTASPSFPYQLESAGWQPTLEFLLSAPESRGPWASACLPPGQGETNHGGTELDRLRSIERCVAIIENLARMGDPDYRAIVWRSGLLDFGTSPRDLAWSVVALRRAGLWADSDVAKPASPRVAVVQPAFVAGLEKPLEPAPEGPILQLPIVSNLEGDYLMGWRRLARRARASIAALRTKGGRIRPGVHLFTLLTHDKFFNARGGRDEFRLERNYGDWQTVHRHIQAWQDAGATFVTARDGVRKALDDLAWRPVPWLEAETFVAHRNEQQSVRYTIRWLGKGLTASAALPQHVPVATPPSLRPYLSGLEISRPDTKLDVPLESENSRFWLRLIDLAEPMICFFRLNKLIGPTLQQAQAIDNGWDLTLTAPKPFRRARLFIPWELLPESPTFDASTSWSASETSGNMLRCSSQFEGVLVSPLAFHRQPKLSMKVRLQRVPAN